MNLAGSLFSKAENILLPVGTTSNESLHAEINGWFRQTQNLHPATLKLKLSILTLSKLLAHNSALYSPTARQMLSSHVLARRIGCGLWAPEECVAWAGRNKAELPMEKARQKEAQRLKQFRAKRPAAARKRPAAKGHRTPFGRPEGWRAQSPVSFQREVRDAIGEVKKTCVEWRIAGV